MFLHRVRIFTLAGFTVWIDASWLIIAALLIWSLSFGLFPYFVPRQSMATYLWMGVAGAIGLFLSIVIHEFAHALMARRHHMPIVGITLFIFGGVAELPKEPTNAKTEFLMAIVGPISSFLLGICFMIMGMPNAEPPAIHGVFFYLVSLNWILALFNLVPAFPLDGGRMLRAALWHWLGDFGRATRIATASGQLFGVALILVGVVQFCVGNVLGGIWMFFIGLFLHGAAGTARQQLVVRHTLAGIRVSAFMQRNPVIVGAGLTIETLVDDYFYRYFFHAFPVVHEKALIGCIMASQVSALPRSDWTRFRVADVMNPCSSEIIIPPTCDAIDALSKMQASHHKRLLVVDGKDLCGILTLSDMLQYLSLKEELRAPSILGESLNGVTGHA